MHLFEKGGPNNTEKTVELAGQRAAELGIKHIVVASNSGATAKLLLDMDINVVCVTHQAGYKESGLDEMEPEVRAELQEQGVKVLTTTHLMAGLDRAVRFKFSGLYPAEIIANTLRIFGQGVKVCVEISGMALDAGMIPYGEDIIAVAGSGTGADTAAVLQPAHSQHFFENRVREIICMPRG